MACSSMLKVHHKIGSKRKVEYKLSECWSYASIPIENHFAEAERQADWTFKEISIQSQANGKDKEEPSADMHDMNTVFRISAQVTFKVHFKMCLIKYFKQILNFK